MARVAFTGGRREIARSDVLDGLRHKFNITEVYVGDAMGVDRDVWDWAKQRGIKFTRLKAHWDVWGNMAGPVRNGQMLDLKPDLLIAFPGGTGTKNCITQANERRISVEYV
jgi:hypothetical protein